MIRINSTEVLDAIFEECNVPFADRVPLMNLLQESNGVTLIKQAMDSETRALVERNNIAKI